MHKPTLRLSRWVLALAVVSFTALGAGAADLTKQQLDFFEAKIRPILVNECYKCHSKEASKIKGGLLVDSRDAILKGGDTGPSIIPGDPDKSLLIKAVTYQDPDLKMPPADKKLSPTQIADLTAWVKMGAPDPRTGAAVASAGGSYKGAAHKDHWAYQPVKKVDAPKVSDSSWVKNPIDAFILAKQEEKSIKPSAPADKRALLRRATFDLIGLPPTPEELDAFLADNSPEAFTKVVDRLLKSPHYGERWGRYWLDVARYSDTKGDVNARREGPLYPYAWTYRDYVINSFNDDKPYDQFIKEQIAADKLPLGEDKAALAALGFLTLGNRFDGNMNDIINDRIDVVTKGTLAMTVACARCHDHMFDPIPTKDYYSLHGIFASSTEPTEKPLLHKAVDSPQYQDYLKKKAELEKSEEDYIDKTAETIMTEFRSKAAPYLYLSTMSNADRGGYMKQNKLNPDISRLWQRALGGKRKTDPIFGPWHTFAALGEKEFAKEAPKIQSNIIVNRDPKNPINPQISLAFRGIQLRTMADVATAYGKAFGAAQVAWDGIYSVYEKKKSMTANPGPKPTSLNDRNLEAIRLVPLPQMGRNMSMDEAQTRLFSQGQQRKLTDFKNRLAKLDMEHPGAPPRAMALLDSNTPKDSPVFIRGEAENKGDPAPRRFLEILSGPNRQPFHIGSGRLELAASIANKNNPLTARVMVNRVWMHHFGEGFIGTPDDFGTMSEPPSHPELLDWLASKFMDDGWSLKKLHRLIMTSNTYQQSSEDNPRFAQADPNNRLLWRANIRRLDFEGLRDSIIYFGGKLDGTVGGQPVDLNTAVGKYRRTVYGRVDRANLPEVFNNFDFANPDMETGRRYETIVPQQSLFLMNSPVVIEQAQNVVRRKDFSALKNDEDRVKFLYNLFYQRLPKPEEVKLGIHFLGEVPAPKLAGPVVAPEKVFVAAVAPPAKGKKGKAAPAAKAAPEEKRPLTAWEQYAQALLLANEATFVN